MIIGILIIVIRIPFIERVYVQEGIIDNRNIL